MSINKLTQILTKYNIATNALSVEIINQGLINTTWKITNNEKVYILQQINDLVFVRPDDIECNINLLANYIIKNTRDYFFVAPIYLNEINHLYKETETNKYYRLFPFVPDSHSKSVVENSAQAYQAAKQFGKFTHELAQLDARKLKITIADFHNLSLRFQQFKTAIENGNTKRIAKAAKLIEDLLAFSYIVDIYEKIKNNPAFKIRVTHHDTKISNVLFNSQNQGICVIDLDTVMPGYFISDLGDMMRTYLCPVSEESTSWDNIEVRIDVYEAIVAGYMEEMKDELSDEEKAHVYYSGCFMIYMQALRFATDYLNDDIYYGRNYEEHNYNRALNQYYLLKDLDSKRDLLHQLQFEF